MTHKPIDLMTNTPVSLSLHILPHMRKTLFSPLQTRSPDISNWIRVTHFSDILTKIKDFHQEKGSRQVNYVPIFWPHCDITLMDCYKFSLHHALRVLSITFYAVVGRFGSLGVQIYITRRSVIACNICHLFTPKTLHIYLSKQNIYGNLLSWC